LILADQDDPYYLLAEEISQLEAVPSVHTVADAIEKHPILN
jgi:hypothetical protein